MKKTVLSSIAGLLMGAGVLLAQAPEIVPAPPGMSPTAPTNGFSPTGGFSGEPAVSYPSGATLAQPGYFDVKMDYLLWWLQSPNFVGPTVTTGLPGDPGTNTLFGAVRIPYSREPLSGGRISLGYFLYDPNVDPYIARSPCGGFEANYFDMGRRALTFSNDTAEQILRPFFDLNNRDQNAFVVGFPGFVTGGLSIRNTFDFWGAEANFWRNIFFNYPVSIARVDLMAGFRYFDLSEDFQFRSGSTYPSPQPAGSAFDFLAGDTLIVSDLFAARNQFYGGQVGANFKFLFGAFDFSVGGKVALGSNNAQIRIDGSQLRIQEDGTRTLYRGGVLALPTNIGRHERNLLAWMPEINSQIIANLTDNIAFRCGLTFLFLSRAYRPGVQIDRVIDITQIPNFPDGGVQPTGLRRPDVLFKETEVWALGLNFGVELKW